MKISTKLYKVKEKWMAKLLLFGLVIYHLTHDSQAAFYKTANLPKKK